MGGLVSLLRPSTALLQLKRADELTLSMPAALWTLLLCGVAAGVSYGIVWGIDHHWPKH